MTKRMGSAIYFILFSLALICLLSPASAAAIKGSNVWDQDEKMPSTYTWTPSIYSGLWYDIDKGVHTEDITITVSEGDRTIDADDAEYITEARPNRFSYSDWGSYRVIGWMGEPYFAGYTRSSSGNSSTAQFADANVSTLSKEKIYKVLLDSNTERRIGSGETYSLEDGYRIRVSEINESGNNFHLTLEKSGDVIKSGTVSSNSTFVYKKSSGDLDDVPIIAIHIKGVDGTRAVIDGIFQISESATSVNVGKKVDAMEIRNVNETRITMRNPSDIKLNSGRTITLMGHVKIDVKDTSKLKFELISDPKTAAEKEYPGRSAIYDESNNIRSWNGMNYPELSYDYDKNNEIEKITLNGSGSISRTIVSKQIQYQIGTSNEAFKYSNWGSYQAISIGDSDYFAGYLRYNSSDRNNTTNFTDTTVGILAGGSVSKVLMNNGSEQQYNVNSNIRLEEGYTLQVGNLVDNGSKVNLILKKDGSTVKEMTVSQGNDFIYETAIGNTTVPIIAVRVTTIFNGSTEFIKVGGIFQISSDSVDVRAGQTMGNMLVEYTGSNALILVNKDSINLEKGANISLIENISIHVADSDELRFFLFGKSTGSSTTTPSMRIELPETVYAGEEVNIKITYNDNGSWKELSGATVKVNGGSIGETNSSGLIKYAVGSSGAYEFRVEKSGYQPASLTKAAIDGGGPLRIVIPDYIFAEDSFRLYVIDSENKEAAGAAIYKNGAHIGTTNDNGLINVTADSTAGTYTLTASKIGYVTGTQEMKILEFGPYFAVTSVQFPEEAFANKTVKIPMTIENVGKEKATQEIIIAVGETTKTEKVTLESGKSKNITFSFKPTDAGDVKIQAANETFSLTVTEKPKAEIPWTMILLGGGLLIIIIGAVFALMYYNEKAEEEKKNPKAKSVKSKPVAAKPTKSAKQTVKPTETSQPKRSTSFSSSNKSPELKNSQKKARK